MSGTGPRFLVTVVTIYLLAGLGVALGTLSESWFAPDFFLIATCCLGLFYPRTGSMAIGFSCGVIQGAFVGANLTWYALTRLIAGWLVSLFKTMDVEHSPWVAAFVTMVVSFLCQLVLLFVAPSAAIGVALLATIGTALVNGVLAAPVFALLKRVLDPGNR